MSKLIVTHAAGGGSSVRYLNDLQDVTLSALSDNDILSWDSTANVFVNIPNNPNLNGTYLRLDTSNGPLTDDLHVQGSLRIGNDTVAQEGKIRWTGGDFEGYDGTSWVSFTSSSGSGTPAGADTQIQYNDSGSFGASANLTFVADKLTLSAGTGVNEFSTDGTLAGDSDDAVPTEKAVKAYVDASGGVTSINDLSDVNAPSPSDGEILAWDATSSTYINSDRFVLNTVSLSGSDGTADCDIISVGSGGSVFWFYDASRGAVKQGGMLMTTWNSSGSVATLVKLATDETTTYGVGDSSDLSFLALVSGGNVILQAASVNNWTIGIRRLSL